MVSGTKVRVRRSKVWVQLNRVFQQSNGAGLVPLQSRRRSFAVRLQRLQRGSSRFIQRLVKLFYGCQRLAKLSTHGGNGRAKCAQHVFFLRSLPLLLSDVVAIRRV